MERMQYRLIGASVVVLIVVLFAPSFIQHMNREQSAPVMMQPSSAPAVKFEKHAQLTQSHQVTHSAPVVAKAVVAKAPVRQNEVARTVASKHSADAVLAKQVKVALSQPHHLAAQYTVQLASFKSDAKAQALIASLQKHKLSAYSHRKENSAYTAVFVGPLKAKQDAEQLLAKLDKTYHTQGLVTKYTQQHA